MAVALVQRTHLGRPIGDGTAACAWDASGLRVGRTPGRSDRRTALRMSRHEAARLGRTIFIALLVCAALVVMVSRTVRPAPPAPDAWASVTVTESATLWALAESHPVPGLSTAETVTLIRESNALPSATIHEGQVLRVPAQLDVALAVASR